MIRRDYLVRMIQELTQALARILFLKKAQNYARGLQEIESVLSRFWNLTTNQIKTFSVDQWIEQCRQEEGPMGEKLVALADLLHEQGELYGLDAKAAQSSPLDQPPSTEAEIDSRHSLSAALGLYLEAAATPGTIISVDLLEKITQLIGRAEDWPLPSEVLKRLVSYYETRGMLPKAEDALFDWLDTGDPNAIKEGLAFYARLALKSDSELDRSGLPRNEVAEGRSEVLRRSGAATF